jgi:AcrR family transcriptional regulator
MNDPVTAGEATGQPAHRRHGEEWRTAVLEAAVAEITEVGLRRTTIDAIATRAGTGKAAIYRRWPNLRALVLDVAVTALESMEPARPVDTGSLRDDLLEEFRALSAALAGRIGPLLRAMIGETTHDETFLAELTDRYGVRRYLQVATMLERAMIRGDIPRQVVDPHVIQIAPALTFHQYLVTGAPPTDAQLVHIVDNLVMRLLRTPSPTPPPDTPGGMLAAV